MSRQMSPVAEFHFRWIHKLTEIFMQFCFRVVPLMLTVRTHHKKNLSVNSRRYRSHKWQPVLGDRQKEMNSKDFYLRTMLSTVSNKPQEGRTHEKNCFWLLFLVYSTKKDNWGNKKSGVHFYFPTSYSSHLFYKRKTKHLHLSIIPLTVNIQKKKIKKKSWWKTSIPKNEQSYSKHWKPEEEPNKQKTRSSKTILKNYLQ